MSVTENITESIDKPLNQSLNIRHRVPVDSGGLYEAVRTDTSTDTEKNNTVKEEKSVEKDGELKEKSIDGECHETDTGKTKTKHKKKHKKPKHSRNLEKTTFIATSTFMVVLSHAVLSFQWMLPYMYIIFTPFVIGIRLSMYWNKQWQHFMLDFCYYVNIICFVFLSMPDSRVIFSVMYILSSGPLMWAIFIYQKSLVLHRIDKVTSSYLHILPPLLSFTVRWYPTDASKYWFQEFLHETDNLSLFLIYVLPFTVFLCYSVIYAIVDNFLWNHNDVTGTTRRREDMDDLVALHSLFFCVDDRCRCLMFYIRVWIFCIFTMIGCHICLYSYTANYIFVAGLGLVAVWNGGSYYVHVFSAKGFPEEKEELKH